MRVIDLLIMAAIVASFATNKWHYRYHQWLTAAWTSAWFEHEAERNDLDPKVRDVCTRVARMARLKLPSGLVSELMRRARADVSAQLAAKRGEP